MEDYNLKVLGDFNSLESALKCVVELCTGRTRKLSASGCAKGLLVMDLHFMLDKVFSGYQGVRVLEPLDKTILTLVTINDDKIWQNINDSLPLVTTMFHRAVSEFSGKAVGKYENSKQITIKITL